MRNSTRAEAYTPWNRENDKKIDLSTYSRRTETLVQHANAYIEFDKNEFVWRVVVGEWRAFENLLVHGCSNVWCEGGGKLKVIAQHAGVRFDLCMRVCGWVCVNMRV